MSTNKQKNPKTKLEVVYLVPRFHPFKGGAEENAYQLARGLAAAGNKVTVLTTDADPEPEGLRQLPARDTLEGMEIIRVHRWNQQLNLGFYPGLLPALLRLKPDIIHVQNGPGFIWQEFCLILKKLIHPRTKIIITPHGPFLATSQSVRWKQLVALPARLLMPIYFKLIWSRLFSLFIQVNPAQTEWLTADYGVDPQKIITLPNGIDRELISPKVRRKFSEPQVTISFIGRFEQYKGVQDVLSALKRLLEQELASPESLRFVALGRPGTYFAVLEELAEKLGLDEVIEFLTNPTDQEKFTILRQESIINILPSEWEATGIVLLEAMASGNAIITTTGNEAHPVLIDQGVNGYVYDYGDIERLTEILAHLINDRELIAQMADLNLEKVADFTWDKILVKYRQALADIT